MHSILGWWLCLGAIEPSARLYCWIDGFSSFSCIFIKLVSRWNHKVLQNLLADGSVDFGLDNTQWTNTSSVGPLCIIKSKVNTIIHKSSLTSETSHWTSSNMDSVLLHTSSRLWDLDFQMKCKMYFYLKKRTLDH